MHSNRYFPFLCLSLFPFLSPTPSSLFGLIRLAMQQAPGNATSPLSWNQHPVMNNTTTGSVSSSSPINSPMASPLHSPCDSPREQLHNQFARQVSLQPPPATSNTPSSSQTSAKPGSGNTFVHKLFK